MNNQAAQTMPELPEPELMTHLGREGYTADQMHQYARDYAAALAQTAGVPDRKTLFEQAEVLSACYRLKDLVEGVGCERWQNANGFRLKDTQQWVEFYNVVTRMQRLEYPPAAAPSASGVHPDALPDGTLSKSTAKRVTALAAASVSERARELLAAEYSKCGMQQCAADIRSGVFAAAQQLAVNAIKAALEQKVPSGEVAIVCDWRGADPFPTFIEAEVGGKSISLEWRDRPNGLKELIVPVTDSALRALEQALTKQRGEAVAEVRKGYIDNFVFCPDPNSLPIGTKLYTTTPQPSADAVRELVKRWRGSGKAIAHICADELESLLSAASGEKGVG